jgi:hypothetical protein
MRAEIEHRALEAVVLHLRHGDEKLAGERVQFTSPSQIIEINAPTRERKDRTARVRGPKGRSED